MRRQKETSRKTTCESALGGLPARQQSRHARAGLDSSALVAEDHRSLRWVIDPESERITRGNGEVGSVITGTAQGFVLLLTGDKNMGVLLRSGRISHLVAGGDDASRAVAEEVRALVTLMRVGGSTVSDGTGVGAGWT